MVTTDSGWKWLYLAWFCWFSLSYSRRLTEDEPPRFWDRNVKKIECTAIMAGMTEAVEKVRSKNIHTSLQKAVHNGDKPKNLFGHWMRGFIDISATDRRNPWFFQYGMPLIGHKNFSRTSWGKKWYTADNLQLEIFPLRLFPAPSEHSFPFIFAVTFW